MDTRVSVAMRKVYISHSVQRVLHMLNDKCCVPDTDIFQKFTYQLFFQTLGIRTFKECISQEKPWVSYEPLHDYTSGNLGFEALDLRI